MEKRIFTLILVVIIGVLAGVGIVTKQSRESALNDVVKQLNVVLDSQKKIESSVAGSVAGGGAGVAALLQKQATLEAKIVALETKVQNLEGLVKNAGNNAPPPGPPPEDYSKVYQIDTAQSYVRGNKNAPVSIVEFVDFQCPFCARFHPPINEVLEMYPNKVNYVLKNFPLQFHPFAKPAAKAALAAGEQGKYWEMADAILDNNSNLSEAKFDELAKQIGLDMKKFKTDLSSKDQQWENLIGGDLALGQKVNVRGTPTFYLNGRKTNARDVDSFKREIDQILNK